MNLSREGYMRSNFNYSKQKGMNLSKVSDWYSSPNIILVFFFFYDSLTVHRDTSPQYEPTGCTVCFQFTSIINLYMFRAGLLLIIRMY